MRSPLGIDPRGSLLREQVPGSHPGKAVREGRQLLARATPPVVLHGDLHHDNILSARREPWLAIDPKGIIGPREADAAALLRNPRAFVLSLRARIF